MRLRDDPTTFEHVPFESTPWLPSPTATVERKMLERIGDEVARATSIVRYAPLSAFPEHVHEKGEEFIVLTGTFSDEHADYPEGSYVRNPPGSRHRPFSKAGCIIFVKLRQFAPDDARHSVVRLETVLGEKAASPVLLHGFGRERVSLLHLSAGATFDVGDSDEGVELFVIRGSLDVGSAHCGVWSWLRAPRLAAPLRTETGCVVWVKQGHLPGAG